MTALLFTAPSFRPLSLTGAIMPGAYVQFYEAGTLTPAAVYSDAALSTPLGVEVEANADGVFPPIYLDRRVRYRAQIYDEDDVLQLDVDPLGTFLDQPPGTIAMFFGDDTARDAAYPPADWAICDGTNGTPDLVGRFPKGVDGGEAAGDTGGDSTVTTTAAGAHDHGGAVSSESLTIAQMPEHSHRVLGDTNSVSTEVNGLGNALARSIGGRPAIVSTSYLENVGTTGSEVNEPTGDGDPHEHDITAANDHTHDVDAMPPWCALWFLMRLGS